MLRTMEKGSQGLLNPLNEAIARELLEGHHDTFTGLAEEV